MRLTLFSKTLDWPLIIAPIILIVFGIIVIYSLSYANAPGLAVSQSVYALLGALATLVLIFIDYRVWRGWAYFVYIVNNILLLLVLFLGNTTFGAKSWIDFGFFQLQPSESMKFVLVIVLARYLTDNQHNTIRKIIGTFILTAIPAGLILAQPDLGSASVLMLGALVLLIVARIPKWLISSLVIAIIGMIPLIYSILQPYQKQRVMTFLDPQSDPTGAGYNVLQSKIAIGSGGLWGRGLGEGSQSQLNFLPVAHTDFIFAGVAEATGFIGAVFLLGLIALVIVRCVQMAKETTDNFARLIAVGIGAMIFYQTFINTGGNLGLVPVTGIPFPFVSFGGSSLISSLAALGILQSIYMRNKVSYR